MMNYIYMHACIRKNIHVPVRYDNLSDEGDFPNNVVAIIEWHVLTHIPESGNRVRLKSLSRGMAGKAYELIGIRKMGA